MGRRFAVFGLVGAVAAGAALFATVPSAPGIAATQSATFIVPANDGYGVGDCANCGQVVADQWCIAQGFARSSSFGTADPADVTGSIVTRAAENRPISITCAE